MERITVIGSGTMGTGIAYTAAISGFIVTVNDISETQLKKAQEYIYELLNDSLSKGFITKETFDDAKKNTYFELDFKQSVKDADLIIEAVLEKIDLKIDVFKRADKYCPDHTIFATNTSTMSPTEIGAQTSRPDKFIAMHFFNPVHKMKLIELAKGLDTSTETIDTIKEVAKKMKKEVVEVNEFPGFVTSRLNCLIGNEAMNMFMEGIASAEDIDKAVKLGLGHPMGPLELADLVGLDSRLRNMEYLHQTLGEKYRPSPILVKYVKAGRYGRKNGQGFYDYTNEKQGDQ